MDHVFSMRLGLPGASSTMNDIEHNQIRTEKPCFLCGGPASGDDRSAEHIILAALGGRRRVSGFICRRCNSETGTTWDAALADGLEDMGRLLDISRERGPVPSKTVHTSDGMPIKIHPGNQIELAHSYPTDFEDGNKRITRLTARSVVELREMVRKFIDRKGLPVDLETFMAGASSNERYLQEALPHEVGTGGIDGEKSLVKSALALMFDSGVDPNVAKVAKSYLTRDDAPSCIFSHYRTDLVAERIPGMPINCVYVTGDPATGALLAYVEIFGFVRRVIRLSDDYDGKPFEHQYAIDPTDGKEHQVTVRLDPTVLLEAENEPDPVWESQALAEALRHAIELALGKAERKTMQSLVETAVNSWRDEHGKQPGDELTAEQAASLSSYVAEACAPYALHRMLPIYLPDYALREFTQGDTPETQQWS